MFSFLDETGLKIGTLLAGFLGSMASLGYDRPTGKVEAVTRLLSGAAAASYIAPLAATWLGMSQAQENGLAFLVGVMSMHIIGGLFRISRQFAANPRKFIDDARKRIAGKD